MLTILNQRIGSTQNKSESRFSGRACLYKQMLYTTDIDKVDILI